MRIDWDIPIAMDDGLVLRARRLPPGQPRLRAVMTLYLHDSYVLISVIP